MALADSLSPPLTPPSQLQAESPHWTREDMVGVSACEPANQEEAAEEGPVVMEEAEKVTVVTIEEAAEEGPVVMAEQVTMVTMEEAVEEGPVVIEEQVTVVTMEEGTDPNQGM
ncbi:hypothetical protein J4Q44_G00045680 [Coregonus suidteri]|uniref:Uncharacterized protein n=1 Tax=Coregonus suidteri TaxID=861788 RepID=A0AAN8MF56_9TELE